MARNKKSPAVKPTKPAKAPKAVKEKKSRKAKTAERDPLVRDLPCALGDEEREDHSMRASIMAHERKRLLVEMKRRDKADRLELRGMATEIERLSDEAATGFEIRPVQCAEEIDGTEVKLIRTDTGEEVERRPITQEEATHDLFPGEQKERAGGFLTGEEEEA